MKKILPKLVFVFLLLSLAGGSARAQGRLATVDLRKVFEGYFKKKQAQAVIEEQKADMEKDIKAMLAEYEKAKSEYQTLLGDANNLSLSAEERDKRKRSAEDKLKQLGESEASIRKYQSQAESTLDEKRKRLRDNIVVDIRRVITTKAKAAGYSLVFDTSAESLNQTPAILYSNNENDITETILTELNLAAPIEPPKTDDKKQEPKTDKKKDEKKK